MSKTIFRNLMCLLICIICNTYANTAAQHLSQLLKHFETYQAEFKQVTFSESGKTLQVSNGVMQIKRPGKFRWESRNPIKQTIITNGETLWTYDVDLAQVTQQQLSKRTTVDPAMLLSGSLTNLNELFTITSFKRLDDLIFVLKPKKNNLGFLSVTLSFRDQCLVNMKIVNNLDQITVFTFSKIKLNQGLPESLFKLAPKPGIDVITE